MHQFLIDQVNISVFNNDMIPKCTNIMVVDEEIQLDELDALKADLLSLQASVHKLVCQLFICLPSYLFIFIAASIY